MKRRSSPSSSAPTPAAFPQAELGTLRALTKGGLRSCAWPRSSSAQGDACEFVRAFAGSTRQVADYLAIDILQTINLIFASSWWGLRSSAAYAGRFAARRAPAPGPRPCTRPRSSSSSSPLPGLACALTWVNFVMGGCAAALALKMMVPWQACRGGSFSKASSESASSGHSKADRFAVPPGCTGLSGTLADLSQGRAVSTPAIRP